MMCDAAAVSTASSFNKCLCQKVNAHLYTVSSVDKIAAGIVISICFWCDTPVQLDQVSAISSWMPVGGAYGEKKTIRRCVVLEAVFMQMFVALWCHLAPQIQTSHFWSLIK